MNSDEEKNIIKKKPVVRAPERRALKAEDGDEDRIMSTDDEEAVNKRRKDRKDKVKKDKAAEEATEGLLDALEMDHQINSGEDGEEVIPVKKNKARRRGKPDQEAEVGRESSAIKRDLLKKADKLRQQTKREANEIGNAEEMDAEEDETAAL